VRCSNNSRCARDFVTLVLEVLASMLHMCDDSSRRFVNTQLGICFIHMFVLMYLCFRNVDTFFLVFETK
jgi:hypothetical protein